MTFKQENLHNDNRIIAFLVVGKECHNNVLVLHNRIIRRGGIFLNDQKFLYDYHFRPIPTISQIKTDVRQLIWRQFREIQKSN